MARRIQPAEWGVHKTEIEAIYIKQNQNLEQLMKSMEGNHGFSASKAQYITKLKQWGFEKNISSEKWKFIARQLRKRKLEGKDSETYINGRLVPHKKIKKEIARYNIPTLEDRWQRELSSDPPEGIVVSTPSYEGITIAECSHIPWLEFQALVEPQLERFRLLTQNNFLKKPGLSIPSQKGKNSPFIDLTTSTTSPWWPPNEALPFSTNGPPPCQLKRPCPHRSGPPSVCNECGGDNIQVSSAPSNPNREARSLLAESLGSKLDPDSTDYVSEISGCLNDTTIEAHGGELERNVSKLCGMSGIEASVQFVRYSIYLSSNNLLSNSQTDGFLQWTLGNEVFYIVEELLKLKLPTVEILASNLLLSAIRQDDYDTVSIIIAIGVEINAVGGQDPPQAALIAAIKKPVEKQSTDLLELLLDAGADSNVKDITSGKSAIETALSSGSSIKFVQMLVEAGADANVPLYEGNLLKQLLDQAISESDFELIQILLGAKALLTEPAAFQISMLQKIASYDDVGLIRALFELGRYFGIAADRSQMGLGEEDEQAVTLESIFEGLLEHAVTTSNSELMFLLLEARSNPEGSQGQGSTVEQQVPQDPRCLESAFHAFEEGWSYIAVGAPLLIRMMLKVGVNVDVRSKGGDTPLQLAASGGETQICKMLLKHGADVNAFPGEELGMTALQAAAETGEYDLVELLIDAGADINAPGSTALQAAVSLGYLEIVDMLIDLGANTNTDPSAPFCRTPLQIAAGIGHIELVKLLINAGADVNAPAAELNGRTAIQSAAKKGFIEVVEFLIRAGADINAPAGRINGRTALQVAAEYCKNEVLGIIIREGADVNAPAGEIGGRTALQAAIGGQNVAAVQILLHAGADVDAPPSAENGKSALYAALESQDLDAQLLRMLLRKTTKISTRVDAQAILELAAWRGETDIVKYFINAGVDSSTPGNETCGTALQAAICNRRDDIALILLDAGADVNAPVSSTKVRTALNSAVLLNRIDFVHLLLARGADPNAPVNNTLEVALSSSGVSIETVWTLVHYGASVNGPSSSDKGLPLQIAVARGDVEVVQVLLDAGADVNGIGRNKTTPLQGAIEAGNFDLVKILLHAGADVNAPSATVKGNTALQAAVAINNIQLVRLLLQHGADVNAPAAEIRGATALQRAALVGNLRITLVLLEAGADIDAPPAKEEGRTALDAAAEHGRLDILHLLLKNDREQDTLLVRCEQAAKLATENGHLVIARILREFKKT